MMYKAVQQEVDLWEAWIEFDHVSDESFGTFYMIGEARLKSKSRSPRFLKEMDTEIPGRLNLYLQDADVNGKETEVIYAEPVNRLNQFRSVAIYANGELLTEISHIEILI